MLRGMDTAASGMIALQRRQDLLTNNVANSNTPGYKQDNSVLRAFPEMLLERLNDGSSQVAPNIGTLQTGVYNQESIPLFTQGDLTSSNSPYDVAIEDKNLTPTIIGGKVVKPAAFFAVQSADGGLRFTRDGHFTVTSNNQLTTANGSVVLQANGAPVSDPELGSGDVAILENGDVIVHPGDPARARTIGTIGTAIVNNPNDLIKEGNDLFRLDGATTGMIGTNQGVVMHQKMLEQSNVDLSQTMSDMMTNIRLFEANQKVLQAYDKSLEQLNTIGRV